MAPVTFAVGSDTIGVGLLCFAIVALFFLWILPGIMWEKTKPPSYFHEHGVAAKHQWQPKSRAADDPLQAPGEIAEPRDTSGRLRDQD